MHLLTTWVGFGLIGYVSMYQTRCISKYRQPTTDKQVLEWRPRLGKRSVGRPQVEAILAGRLVGAGLE
jgi:hypothetical protein